MKNRVDLRRTQFDFEYKGISQVKNRIITIVLLIGLVLACIGLYQTMTSFTHLPGNHQGYEPVQPIAYSHRLHAGELQIPCLYCHFGAEKSKHAGIPPANVCMNCHKFVTAPFGAIRHEDELAQKEGRRPRRLISPEIQKIYTALALNDSLQFDPAKHLIPIQWMQIHKLPDFVYFDHRPHVAAGVECQKCHGAVQTMERVRQQEDLSMGWCVNCHRAVNTDGVAGKNVNAPTDCSACHY